MKPLFVSLILFVPFALASRYYFVCETLQWCEREGLRAASATAATTLSLPDGSTRSLALGTYAEGQAKLPRTAALLSAYDTLAAVALRSEDELLAIAAPYRRSEPTGAVGHYRNLGLARAAALAEELQRRGVPGERLELLSYPADEGAALRPELSFVEAAPEFEVGTLPTGAALLDSTALLGLRFASNSTALSPSDEFVAYATELVEALNADTSLEVTLTGHTDSRAATAFNDSLGLWRAEAVARYLAQLGYERPIATASRGERAPIADNATREGRYLNRRVDVRID